MKLAAFQNISPKVGWLSLCFALSASSASMVVSSASIVGKAIAENPAWATLPFSLNLLGTMCASIPASFLMQKLGRRNGFRLGALIGMAGTLINAFAISQESFFLFCLGTFFIGLMLGVGQLYRFAAVDVSAPAQKARAVSLVMAGGILAGILGPFIASKTKTLLDWGDFSGGYLSLAGLYILILLVLQFLRLPEAHETAADQAAEKRPLSVIFRQPQLIIAIICQAVGYAVMVMVMTATPLAMAVCSHPFDDTAVVIQWHVVAMFAPSFITGSLIQKFGAPTIAGMGVLLNLLCVWINLQGISFWHFWTALILLGVGWNFLFVAGTSMLTETYRPSEKAVVQGINDFIVFGCAGIGSLLAGVLQQNYGWVFTNQISILPLMPVALVLLWLLFRSRLPRWKTS